MPTKKCNNCGLVNFASSEECSRCSKLLDQPVNIASKPHFLKSTLVKRALICLLVIAITLFGFYFSLLISAKRLTLAEQQKVTDAVAILDEAGFDREVFYLRYLTAFRSNDNWLNASVPKETAYAATNYPFEIMTLYPRFFERTVDDTERAAILLHEARHLRGLDENDAYSFVWKNKDRIGWTPQKYRGTELFVIVLGDTKDYAPGLFNCPQKPENDCTMP